ncbi:CBS domain-containing protein [Leptolyngbyaceae cyanobacterium CCMR0082]|uniref:CBS domain-containing protein n=1 Tax=Adonisia turfae CCMR0082 TaxID=2304604 RepID=A0A6M0S2T7_9CYAN|nr:CBS domain-containing protein [Adonisia turfae]MDV3349390.1 CBS domain-containing protein [Leptothoe sp. LEGE 181152]NEZ62804.1 CBS domain-containing protein [Adonisia turfae CCMR0082]
MDLILCHTTADFDTLGAAVGLACLNPGSRIVLTGGAHPAVKSFLALHRDEYPLIERRAVTTSMIRSITLVDTHQRHRLGTAAAWIEHAIATQLPITIYDHHTESSPDMPGKTHIEAVGATTTLVVEALQQSDRQISSTQATVMALGIHVDTGSLTFAQATARDAYALAWLMEQGANQQTIAEAVEPGLSTTLQNLLSTALDTTKIQQIEGYTIGTIYLKTDTFVPGLSGLASHLIALLGLDSLLLGSVYTSKAKPRLTLIGRTRPQTGMNCRALLQPHGGGGHVCAASANLTSDEPETIFHQLCDAVVQSHTQSVTAQDVMSSPVRTIRPATTVADAQRILLRYGHAGLCVADDIGKLQGIISRRDIDLALHHGFSHAPVKGYMTLNLKTITPYTPLSEIQALMVTYDVGRLPVLDGNELVGIVTRTDVLRQMYPPQAVDDDALTPLKTNVYERLQTSLQAYPTALESKELWTLLTHIALAAQEQGWHLYLVGGAVRDLLLAPIDQMVPLKDIDLVVDSFRSPVVEGAGIVLAQQLQQQYPDAELQIHGEFQTAALIWRTRAGHAPLMIDIATARTEFYPYPAANPEVEPSSIRQDLYRRDFTINAMAIRLTSPQPGLLLDFFGGYLDIQQRQVRVLHANSFIEDPTRIFRAVRFAVRLGFGLDSQTETFIRYAVDSGIYADLQAQQTKKRMPALQTRLKAELTYIFQADYWAQSLGLLDKLGALSCLHPSLTIDADLWRQMHRAGRWRQRFIDEVGKDIGVEAWLIRLEVLLARVEVRSQIATNLQLPLGSIQRLQQLAQVENQLLEQFQHADQPQPSFIYQTLAPHDLPSLLLISVRHPRSIGTYIWYYISHLIHICPPINGHHLKQLGYIPGPLYRQILTALTHATLDGEINSIASAETYLHHHYPLEVK